jgi:hypothetical protein
LTNISTEADRFYGRYAYPDWLRTHSRLVGRIAEALVARCHEDGTFARDVALAGYLHDIGRSPLLEGDPREHNELSALVLAAEGLPGCVEPARRHAIYTVLDPSTTPTTLAERIVYVADRRGGMRVQSLEDRARDTAERHPRYAREIARAIPIAQDIERRLFADLGLEPDELETGIPA